MGKVNRVLQLFPERQDQCATHGPYAAFQLRDRRTGAERWTGCEQCAKKSLPSTQTEAEETQRKNAVISKLQQAGIPELYKAAVLELWAQTWIARVLVNETRGPLVLIGPPGTGKTYQSCAALRRWIVRTGLGGHYLPAADFAVQMRSTWGGNRSGESEQDVLNRFARSPFLVLDDLGAGRDNDMSIIQTLIDARCRYGLMCKTIVVSNIAATNFDTAFGERSADRIRENATLIEMLGESRRKPLA
jgi:hypothetical protein